MSAKKFDELDEHVAAKCASQMVAAAIGSRRAYTFEHIKSLYRRCFDMVLDSLGQEEDTE